MKKLFKTFALEFIYGGHLLSFGASGTVLSVILILNLPLNIIILCIAYLMSQIVYSFDHLYEVDDDKQSNPERSAHIKKQKKFENFLFSFYILFLLIALLSCNLYTSLLVLLVVISGIFYTLYFKNILTRRIPGFKNFYIALFWSILVVIVAVFNKSHIGSAFIYIYFFVFLRCIVNSVFFDIKDISSDKKRNLKTFAVILGEKRTIFTLYIINVISFIPLMLGIYTHVLSKASILLIFSLIYSFYYLTKSLFLHGKNLRTISYIIVDAEFILWPILILIGKLIT